MTEMSREQMIALLTEQKALIEKLAAQASAPRRVTMKVAQSGGMSLYGLGRWPVTLYKSQWQRLLSETDAIRAFLKANDQLLADKD